MKLAKIGNTLTDWLAPARDALRQVRDAEQGKRREIAEAEADRARLISAKPPKEDVLAQIRADIAEAGGAWIASHGMSLLNVVLQIQHGPGAAPGLVRYVSLPDVVATPDVSFGFLCATMPDLLHAGLRRVVEGLVYAEGEPVQSRAQLLAEVNERISTLEGQHGNLVTAAGELGLVLEDMPNNAAKKALARQQATREAR